MRSRVGRREHRDDDRIEVDVHALDVRAREIVDVNGVRAAEPGLLLAAGHSGDR